MLAQLNGVVFPSCHRRTVPGKVLHTRTYLARCSHIFSLKAFYLRLCKLSDHVWILAAGLHHTAPSRITHEIRHR